MASKKNRPVLVTEARREIPRLLQTIRDRDYYSVVSDFFELSAISVRNNVDLGPEHDKLEKRYLDIASKYKREQLEVFASALGLFIGEINAAMNGGALFRDFAGEIYMDSGTSNGRTGQFFTPYHVSRLMASCTLERDEVLLRYESDPDHVLTLYEPTCGAGGIIVAAIDVLNSMGVNYAWNVFVDCGDIDPRCVHMTYLTLSLLGVPAVVRLGDALMMDYHQAWFTPAYLFAWPHFKSRIGQGKYPASPTVQKAAENDAEPRKMVSLDDVKPVEEMLPKPHEITNVGIGEQLSLFG